MLRYNGFSIHLSTQRIGLSSVGSTESGTQHEYRLNPTENLISGSSVVYMFIPYEIFTINARHRVRPAG
jgi:hypothetical protein